MATHMADPASDVPHAAAEHLTLEDRVLLLRAMLLMRGLEERAMSLYRQGKVPFRPGGGLRGRRVRDGAGGPALHPPP
jgi:TPP-dependent pyruvate/acetoin dehydrogenase alpha subunit